MLDDIKPPKRYDKSNMKRRGGEEEVDPPEPRFRPPESGTDEELVVEPADSKLNDNKAKRSGMGLPARLKNLKSKQWLIIGLVSLLVIGGGVSALILRKKPAPAPAPVANIEPAPEPPPPPPTTAASRLSGVQVPIEQDKLPVTGVMIENSPDARPQSGLKDAGVVFEAIAEGGITRFLALFQTEQPDYIGPVRSVRPYYLDFLVPFDAAIAHAGGSAQAKAEIIDHGIKDLDHGANAGAFRRANSRFAPHNLYTSRAELLAAQNSRGWSNSEFSGFVRKAETPSPAPNIRSMDFRISGFLYDPHFDYDQPTNSYKRVMAGQPHIDEKTGVQISPKVVIAVVMPHHYEGIYSAYATRGNGRAYIFQDGSLTEGSWEKIDRKSQFRFGDANGSPLGLNPGQTWITLVNDTGQVTYAP